MRTYRPAVLGGVFIGVLSGLPFVGAANFCCCLWVVTGGVLAVYRLQQTQPEPVRETEAILAGLIAGVIGAAISILLSFATMPTTAPMVEERMRQTLDANPQVSPAMRDWMLNVIAGPRVVFLQIAFMLPIYAIVSTLGSLLGLAIFRKKTPPPAAPAP